MALSTAQWLTMLRRKLSDVDTSAARRTNTALLEAAADAALELAVRQVNGFSTIVIDPTGTGSITGAEDDQLLILIYATAYDLLSATYRERVDRGELGISWRSGLEEESSIQAEKAYRQMLDGISNSRDELLITYQRRSSNFRVH